ncbi:SGNH/GDSL hydrolase family protein [Sphingobium sp. CR2-8]|uniref:SGNH/GDSL hydrolase family protein n=1 Tax=Sphingobium sp. CR2-8 TaxID=1306534 RepID=UPI002DBBF1AE|nr:SGNH/GDSL hydrolase family protein [Sphingobium sp. CR2-8]MEC3909284.1 SGNH/GDSL hydrolase family protein [Sphingobium sp. CR2-8]
MLRLNAPLAAIVCALALIVPALAETKVPGDPHADDPVGIVADPCPPHPKPDGQAAWQMENLHMLTRDFGQICRYAADNRAIAGQKVRAVFMGDSITDNWINLDPDMFTGGLVDRGISGQTTAQMLVRFRSDVIALKPQVVHIMAGTNDIAGNTGAATMETVLGHIQTMAELARAHGIAVVIASVPPAAAFPWSPGMKPASQVAAINRWLADYARVNGFTYVDYHGAMAQADGAMKPGLSTDGVHPTAEGYAIMRPLARQAIDKALRAIQ